MALCDKRVLDVEMKRLVLRYMEEYETNNLQIEINASRRNTVEVIKIKVSDRAFLRLGD